MPNNIQLNIADPCHENWILMTDSEQGRYCQSCQKTVTDFSMMTDKEILNHLSRRGADICGRFTVDQLDRRLIGEPKKRFSWAYVWNFAIATFLTVSYADAQQRPARGNKNAATEVNIQTNKGSAEGEFSFVFPEGIRKIEGVVMDSKTNQPIPFATVSVKGTHNSVSADENGKFSLSVMFAANEVMIEVSALRYAPQSFSIAKTSKGNISFYLDRQSEILRDIIDTNGPIQKIKWDGSATNNPPVMGLIIMKEQIPAPKKLERSIDHWTTKVMGRKEMTIYPNPVEPGHSTNITVSIEQTGDFTLEILGTDGQIVHRQKVEINSKHQVITIHTDPSWSKAVYWVRMSGNDSKKVINSKLLLQ